MVEGAGAAREGATIDGLGAWASLRSTQWVRVGSGFAAIAYLGHLVACLVTWPIPIGDPIGEALTFVACGAAYLLAPRRPALGAAISCIAVGSETLAASVIVPTQWVASLPVAPVVVLAVGLFFGARAALRAAAAGALAYPLLLAAAGRIGPSVGGIPPVELSRLVVLVGAVLGSGVLTWFALRALARLHAEAEARHRLEVQLQHAQRLQMVGELASVTVHDLRNVLSIVQNAAGLLEASPDPATREVASQLLQTARSGQTITTRLLSLARREEPRRAVVDVARAVGALESTVHQLIGPGCSMAFTAEGPAPAVADPLELEQVVLNLAANARDAMGGSGRVSIRVVGMDRAGAARLGSTLVAPRQVLLEVGDAGPGVPPELRERIFEPFVTTKARGEGTGLGLATVRSVAQGSGGAVALESEPGAGATFRVFLPEAISPQEAPAPAR